MKSGFCQGLREGKNRQLGVIMFKYIHLLHDGGIKVTRNEIRSRVNQDEYNRHLRAFNAETKPKKDSVNYLISKGFSREQAENAVHVYFKGGQTTASFRLTGDHRDQLLDDFNAKHKTNKECVDYLMAYGCTYRQANSASYNYRKEKGLINT